MRREMGRYARVLIVVTAVACAGGVGRSVAAAAQIQTPDVPAGMGAPGSRGPTTLAVPPDPYAARINHARQVEAANDRRKKMVADANQLLQLATDLKAEVDKQSPDETSASAYMKADQIEKLAHDVKQRLKN